MSNNKPERPPDRPLPKPLRARVDEKIDRFLHALGTETLGHLDGSPFRESLPGVFACSDFVSNICIHSPKIILDLLETGDLVRTYPPGEWADRIRKHTEGINSEQLFSIEMRKLRKREWVRIAWRDIAGWADLKETMAGLSAFADAAVSVSTDFLYDLLSRQYGHPIGDSGAPQQIVVVALGKLGARELNFSSDIDLVFAFPENGITQGGDRSVSNEDFFTMLGRQLLRLLGEKMPEGIVFRMDMRLRPYGESGPLVMCFDAMEQYYQRQGRWWERYAWIKARPVSGNPDQGKRLLHRLQPFIYRRYLDYGAFESLRDMKKKISMEVHRKGMKNNIKLGVGGIREIEFFGQMFQLVRGGVDPALQETGICSVLEYLAQEHYIPDQVKTDLLTAYEFLRILEHRLQQISDQQTHTIPESSMERERIAFSMGADDWNSFTETLEAHRKKVHEHFQALLESPDEEPSATAQIDDLHHVWSSMLENEEAVRILQEAGYQKGEEALRVLQDLKSSTKTRDLSPEGRQRLNKLVPLVVAEAGRHDAPEIVLRRVAQLLRQIQRRTVYMALLLESPTALRHLVQLTAASPYIASFISRHPVLLDELLDPRTLFHPPSREDLQREIRSRLNRLGKEDLEYQMESLRVFRQVSTLRVAAADVTEVLPLMRVSDYLSDIAEVVLQEVVDMAWQYLTEKHGQPVCSLDGETWSRGFAVVAYGKLGGLELGYGSDLDLVFLHCGATGQTTGKTGAIDNSHFFNRLGQRVLHILTAHTPAGILYETDMRLRPSGDSGLLVSHVDGFREYQINEAWTWEHQALLRARAILGNEQIRNAFDRIRRQVLSVQRDPLQLQQDVVEMRERLRESNLKISKEHFDLKHSPGGIVDIEFLVQYLVLLHARKFPALLDWTDNVRLIQTLIESAMIDENQAHILRHAYLIYRAAAHKLSLKESPPIVNRERFADLRKNVVEIWRYFFRTAPSRSK